MPFDLWMEASNAACDAWFKVSFAYWNGWMHVLGGRGYY